MMTPLLAGIPGWKLAVAYLVPPLLLVALTVFIGMLVLWRIEQANATSGRESGDAHDPRTPG